MSSFTAGDGDRTNRRQIALADAHVARNYSPLEIVIERGEGAWVTDVEGNRYLDCLAGYGALNFGHSNPRLVAAATDQLATLTLTSRAFHNDQLGPFAQELAELCGKDLVLPMNTGAEAVETALKVARRWGYQTKGVPADRATIVTMHGNFHGRTTTIVSFSTDEVATRGYGPFTPGFRTVPYGSAAALEAAIDETTVAVLLEPVQGEAGVIVPPKGYLTEVRRLCTETSVLMIADEIQSGLCRTGETFACDLEAVTPDLYVLGKALGGGLLPVSAVVANADVLSVITPGSHGSTFGGNPLAARVGREVVAMVAEGTYQEQARLRGAALHDRMQETFGFGVTELRTVGLWCGFDIDADLMTGRELVTRMAGRGVLAKDAHGQTVRLAPPLTVTEDEIDLLVDAVLASLRA